MMKNAEEKVLKFFNAVGWKAEGEITEDARRWEDLREYAKEYVRKWRLRILNHRTATSGHFFYQIPALNILCGSTGMNGQSTR